MPDAQDPRPSVTAREQRPAPEGRAMKDPYLGPVEGPGIGAAGGVGEGGAHAAMGFAEMIVDTVREGLLVLDLDLRVQAANESFYLMFGVTREETEGRLVYEVGGGVWDLPELRDLLERILPERHTFDDFELEHTFNGVGRRALLLNGRQLSHHQMVLLAIEDVTERRDAAVALRTTEARYRNLFHSMDQGYCVLEMIYDADGRPVNYRFLEANPAFETQSGLKDVVGRTVRELIPDLEDEWVERYGRVAATGEPVRFELESDPLSRWFDVFASRVGDPESRRVALLFSDITERKGIEEARRESERRYRALFAQAPAFIAVLRQPEHRFEFVNQAFLDLIGERDLLGKPVREVLPELEGQGLFEALDGVYASGEPFTGADRPILLQRNRGEDAEERFVDFVYQPLREPDGSVSGVIALGVDTTERVRAREELAQTNRELERRVDARTRQVRRLASKLSVAEQEERRRLAHLLHDDLQQQLFAASLTLSLLNTSESGERQAELVEQVKGTLDEAMKMTRTLSTELSPAVLDTDRLSVVLQWLAARKRELYGLDVEVEGDADVEDPALRTLLYHLVREALFNVAKHAKTDEARILLEEIDGHIGICIQDDGTGFDLNRLREESEGGFGLSSIRERLELVGGRLEVDSAPGAGTRLTLKVPRIPEPGA